MAILNGWLKAIVGDAYTEEHDKAVAEHLGKNFVTKADFGIKTTALATAEASLAERDAQLATLKKLDPEKMQAEITRLQKENKDAATNYQKELADKVLGYAVEAKLSKAGAVNATAVKALLDMTKVSMDTTNGNVIGLDDQVAALQKTEKWAFTAQQETRTHSPTKKAPTGGDGSGAFMDGTKGSSDINAQMNRMIRGEAQGED